MRRDEATERQVQATDPAASTWLSANAGAGKTRVLTDRVARLLLDGADPQHILCLTYTKAAASEMQNRLFSRLGEWAMLDDPALSGALRLLGHEGAMGPDTLARARRLFARALETPGGLRIQTIHAFCAGLLRRFPLEAGVSPAFREMDDRAVARLQAMILEDIAQDLPEGRAALDALALFAGGEGLGALLAEIAAARPGFPADFSPQALWQALGLPAGFGRTDLLAQVFLGDEAALVAQVLPVLRAGKPTDAKAADLLAGLDLAPPGLATLEALEGPFLYGGDAKVPFGARLDRFPTKDTRTALGPALAPLQELMVRVEAARPRRLALGAAEKGAVLYRFAQAFLPRYAAQKEAHGWLDFDDLILKTRALLTDPGVAQWVLFRLDGGIDHILIDEAQDTSPVQWQVIDLLAREFTAGAGARGARARTIFVVGDRKQSIYSFQGADPDGFDEMKARFANRLADAPRPLQDLGLEYSFRSAPAVLAAVDATFPPEARAGLGQNVHHIAFRADLPGRVDLWPPLLPDDEAPPPHWADPVDMRRPEDPKQRLATRVARAVREMIDAGTQVDERGKSRPMHEGDVLVLVQRRDALFHAIIRACKAAGLEVAGADRLKVGGELAVRDIAATLRCVDTEADDLSLAAALRSPLFGWDEAALYALAQPRPKGQTLWEALQAAPDAASAAARAALSDLRQSADFLRPYDLIERLLARHQGRARLIARLGEEAEDGIDALLSQALGYERLEIPSLTGFLTWLDTGDAEIKRQADAAGGRLRVMTVHGAKGLEAPVVVLPDCARRKAGAGPRIAAVGPEGLPAWMLAAEARPPALEASHAERARIGTEENNRLLYVAMTRAAQWLIVGCAGDPGDGPEASWYRKVEAGLARAGAQALGFADGPGLRLETGTWKAGPAPALAPAPATAPSPEPAAPLPGWARSPAPPAPASPAPRAPSDLGGAKIVAGQSEGLDGPEALARGTWIHRLLEDLPPTEEAAHACLASCTPAPGPELLPGLIAEMQAVRALPEAQALFGPGALREVALSAPLAALGGQPIAGVIDRLVIGPHTVLAVDYKTNALIPPTPEEVPEGLLRQMGAYAAALAQIYPGHRIETALLWTRAPRLMPLPDALIAAALARAGAA